MAVAFYRSIIPSFIASSFNSRSDVNADMKIGAMNILDTGNMLTDDINALVRDKYLRSRSSDMDVFTTMPDIMTSQSAHVLDMSAFPGVADDASKHVSNILSLMTVDGKLCGLPL